MYKRPTSAVVCNDCGKEFKKENRAINQTIKRNGGLHYCSKVCAGKGNAKVQYKDITPFNSMFSVIKRRCIQKNLEFDLDMEYLKHLYYEVQKERCAISNVEMKLPIRRRNNYEDKNIYAASIDRIDNSKGYTKGNIQFTVLGVNYMRNTFLTEDAQTLIKDIVKEYNGV